MQVLFQMFLRGLAAILPAFITIYVLWWLCSTLESWFGTAVKWFVAPEYYYTGMGFAAGLLLVLGVGLLLKAWLVRYILRCFERVLEGTPVVKSIYGMFKDVMSFLYSDESEEMRAVVSVQIAGTELIGLVTRKDITDILGTDHANDKLAVFLPMSYQMGGFTVFVPTSEVRELDMDVETGLRLALTAGVKSRKEGR